MKKSFRIFGVLLVIAFMAYGYHRWSDRDLPSMVEQTRRQLRNAGFRTEMSDFDLASPPEVSARAKEMLSAAKALQPLRALNELDLMERVGTNTALAISSVEIIETDRATNLWPLVRQGFVPHDETLDRVCASLLMQPPKFEPEAVRGDIRLPHLADYKRLAQALAVRAALAMHEHRSNDVFTNVLALSRMATAWTPEPTEISHLVRFACVGIAEEAIWESMQADCWNEFQLAALQREWESARFFEGLLETAELACANLIRQCRAARTETYSQKIGGWGPAFRGVLKSPINGSRAFWSVFQGYRQHARYRDHGSYEDEQALLLYYRARHQHLKQAAACSTWIEMRPLPGATNIIVFPGARGSRIQVIMNLKQLTMSFEGHGRTLMSRAAEAETKRRLIVTAIALKRFAIQQREYPQSLIQLVPSFLPAVSMDFMDGNSLRYRRLDDGQYVLHSVGLDGMDNGGQMVSPEFLSNARRSRRRAALQPHLNTDLVWPRRATQEEVNVIEQRSADAERKLLELE